MQLKFLLLDTAARNTQRRQGKLVARGVYYVGCGVSGGYQAARRGPSMCPGGEDQALDIVMPLLKKMAAKATGGGPCVGRIGMGGAEHYVKMIHNGIEHAMMSAISESWTIMTKQMGVKYDVGKVFEKWSSEKELKNTFLVKIGADICEAKDKNGHHVLGDVQDKVVQDIDGSEGTGIWSNTQATSLQVPAPTLSTAHSLRVTSAYRGNREHIKETFHDSFLPSFKTLIQLRKRKEEFIEDLRKAVYTTCLAGYVQGISVIDAADKQNKWSIHFTNVGKIWPSECIIQADHISSLHHKIFHPDSTSVHKNHNFLYELLIVSELKYVFDSPKKIVVMGMKKNAIVPSMSATLEYLKYMGNLKLPTQFYEAELDYFGKHMYDSRSEDTDPGPPKTGDHHHEWKAA